MQASWTIILCALLFITTSAAADLVTPNSTNLLEFESVDLQNNYEIAKGWDTFSYSSFTFNWDKGPGPYFAEISDTSQVLKTLTACQNKCAENWVCVGVYFGPVKENTSKKCVFFSSSYRLLMSSPERHFGTVGSYSELVLGSLDDSYYSKYKAFYMDPDLYSWVDLENFSPAMLLWDTMGNGIGDETRPYVGMRLDTITSKNQLAFSGKVNGYVETKQAHLSFMNSRAPATLEGVPTPADEFVEFSRQAFFPASQNKGMVAISVLLDEAQITNEQECGDLANQLFWPLKKPAKLASSNQRDLLLTDIIMAYAVKMLDSGYLHCIMYSDFARLTRTDNLIFQNRTSLRGLFNDRFGLHNLTVMMPSWAGDDYSWPQSLPASTSWNLTTLAGKIHLSRGMTDDDNYAIFLRSSLASELEVDASQSAIFLVDCADGDDSEQDSLASSVDDFCSVGEGVRAISPFSTGTTMVLDRPEDFTWDTVKCRAMCRYNNDFCLGFNIYDGNCELLTDDALNAGQGDLAWPQQSEAAQLLDCVDASKLAQCTTDQVQPYRISTNQNNPNDHAEFATSGCRVQLKTVRMGNCMGAVKDGYVYSLDVPSTNIEVFDECSALCCENDWCAGVEYIVRQNSSLHTRCNFLLRSEVAALDAYTYREVTYQQRKIKLWRSARQLTSNVADTSITCVTKPGVVSPYSDTESVYLYTGGARCTSASYSAPISASFTFNLTDGLTQAQAQAMAMSNIFQMDDEKVAFCRDYCEKHKAMCKGFMVTFGDRDTVLAKCTLYTSVKAFLDFDVSSFSQLWTNFKKLGSLFVGSVPYEADRTWNVAQLYQYIAEPERDTWHLVSSTLGQETVISSVCYARYDYTMVFQADATIASAYTPVSPRICDLETAYVLRHRTGYIGQKYQSSLLELCENICSENPLACRALMIDTSLGDCILYVNWEALSIETSPFQQLNGMSDQQTVLLNNFRFKRVCSALNFTDDQDSTTDYCANVEQDAQAVTAGISVTGANLTCYIHDEYIPPQSTTIVSFTRLYIIISVSIGVPCLFCCCLACCRPPSDQTEQRFDEEAPLVIEQAPRPHVIHKKVISKPKHHNHHK